MSESINKKERHLISKLFFGDIPLYQTYWGYGVLAKVIFLVITYIISINIFIIERHTPWLPAAFYFPMIAYDVFISIAIFNSAVKYKGSVIWKFLAILAIFFGWVGFILDFSKSNLEEFKEQVPILNQDLPTMIDNDTQLESIKVMGKKIIYNYRLIDYFKKDINIDLLRSKMNSTIKERVCQDSLVRSLLSEGAIMDYTYKDKTDSFLFEILVNSSYCHQ